MVPVAGGWGGGSNRDRGLFGGAEVTDTLRALRGPINQGQESKRAAAYSSCRPLPFASPTSGIPIAGFRTCGGNPARRIWFRVGIGKLFCRPVTSAVRQHCVAPRLPVMYSFRENTEAGGLISYGPDRTDLWRRSADLVDKILRGTKPADIPVEQPTKFDLVII